MANRRVLTLLPASTTVMANMVGTGIFTTTGLMAGMGAGGGDILLAWLLGGLVALCGALCYAEIGANLPHSGGEYYYLTRLLHPSIGFMSGAVSLAVGFAAPVAAAAIAMNLYIASAIDGWPVRWMAAALVGVIGLLHAWDLKIGSRVQTTLTLLKLALIGTFVTRVFFTAPGGPEGLRLDFRPEFLGSPQFAVVLVFVSFAYAGWNAAAYIGAEIRSPERTLPASLILGTAVVTTLYLLLNLSYLTAVPPEGLAGVEEVGHAVGLRLWGEQAANLISMLIALTLVCPISAMLMVGPRIAEAMARDGLISQSIARLNSRGVPSRAVALLTVLAAGIAWTSSFGSLLVYVSYVLNIFAMLTVFSLFRLRRKGGVRVRVCKGYPIPPIVFLAFSAWMTVWSIRAEPGATVAGIVTVAAGYVVYWVRGRRIRLTEDPVPWR